MQNVLPYHEKEIIARLSDGDEAAFEWIYEQYQPRLHLYILPFTGNSNEDTEEVIQDVFVKIWMRRESLPAIDNFARYIFRMARNRFLDTQKKKKDNATAIAGISRADELRSPIHENIIYNEYSALANEAIAALSPQRKRIFLLRYEQDMSFDDIAASLQIAKTSVKKQLYEAVKLVKDYLREHGELPLLIITFILHRFPFR